MPSCFICGKEIEIGESGHHLVGGTLTRDKYGDKVFKEAKTCIWNLHSHASCMINLIKKGYGVKKFEI